MQYYALHVKSGSEDRVSKTILDLGEKLTVFCPKRELIIRKSGKTKKEIKPIFMGYLFMATEFLNASILSKLKTIPDFYRVLPSNDNIIPVNNDEMKLLHTLFKGKQIALLSKVRFDINRNITIIEGPLKGLEGLIVKINTRKGRAKIVLKAFGKVHMVDLGFEMIEEKE